MSAFLRILHVPRSRMLALASLLLLLLLAAASPLAVRGVICTPSPCCPGQYQNGEGDCVPCLVGHSCDGSNAPTPCSFEQYQDEEGQSYCKGCIDGYVSKWDSDSGEGKTTREQACNAW